MTEKTLTTENIKPALDALRGELAPWPVVALKQDRLNDTQKSAVNSGITSSLVAQIIANTAAIRALESAITGTGLRALVVASLPAVGTQGILYIVPVTTYDPETDADVVNYSNEYLWIVAPDAPVTEGYYEQVGQTGIVINNGQLNITVNGTSVGTFTANQSGDTTAAITVPTNADYVDRTTDQTVAGVKTFSSTIDGTASKAIADEDGTSIKTGYVNVAGNQTVTGDKSFTGSNTFNSILPNATNTYSLGSSSYQWASVYAQTYYYKGTAWGLDKANTWSGYNTFTNYIALQESAAIPAGGYGKGIAFKDYQNNRFGYIQPYLTSDSEKRLLIGIDSGDIASNSNIIPNANNAVNLGSSTNQWSSVYSQNYYYKNSALEIGVQPASNNTATTFWLDKNDNNLGYTRFVEYANSIQTYEIYVRNKASNGALNPNGSQIAGSLQLALFPSTATSSVVANTTNIIPGATNAIDLGTSTNQWKSVYSQTYYYKGTAWGLDKANEWTGSNKFKSANSNFGLQSTTAEAGSTTATSNWIYWQDKNGFQDAYISRDVWSDGGDTLRISISGKRSNGAPSTSGASVECGIRLDITANGSKSVRPFDNGGTDLGTSSNRWSSVYADSYYYGTTSFTDKFVTTDTNQTITGIKTFASTIYSKIDATTLSSYKDIYQCQNDAGNRVVTFRVTHSNSVRILSINVHDNNNSAPKGIAISNDGSNNISLTGGGTSNDLGTSTNKWKTFNGINPGALSLPDNSYIDISGDITVRDASAPNSLTALCDGWIAINSFATGLQISDDTTLMATTGAIGADGFAQVFLPVRQGDSIRIVINQTNTLFQSFRLIPCLGNV